MKEPSPLALDVARLGYAVVSDAIEQAFLERLRADVDAWMLRADAIRRRNGLGAVMRGSAHHVLGEEDAMADFIRRLPLDAGLREHFGGPYILNSFGAIRHEAGEATDYAHVHRFHRDVRTYASDFRLMVNMLVMVDDFTVENGATRVLPGSHRVASRPPDEYMETQSVHVVGRAGTIVLFDSNLWHAASPNLNGEPRRALTLNFTRPLMKQQLDYPRLLGNGFSADPKVLEVLGFRSRVPASHDDWYQPPERRFYYSDQG